LRDAESRPRRMKIIATASMVTTTTLTTTIALTTAMMMMMMWMMIVSMMIGLWREIGQFACLNNCDINVSTKATKGAW
jgi:hypothetical protein